MLSDVKELKKIADASYAELKNDVDKVWDEYMSTEISLKLHNAAEIGEYTIQYKISERCFISDAEVIKNILGHEIRNTPRFTGLMVNKAQAALKSAGFVCSVNKEDIESVFPVYNFTIYIPG